MITPLRHSKLLVAALLAGLAIVPAAGAAPAKSQHATSTCWLQVINDWLDNSRVDNTYAIPCYTQAINHLSAYPDVAGYSSAIDDIRRAQLAAIRQEHNTAVSGGDPSNGNSSGLGGGPGPGGGNNGPGGSSGSGHGGFPWIGGPSSATSIPLPLIVLGGLAILLALAALGTWLARRFQTRRPATAPAVARRR